MLQLKLQSMLSSIQLYQSGIILTTDCDKLPEQVKLVSTLNPITSLIYSYEQTCFSYRKYIAKHCVLQHIISLKAENEELKRQLSQNKPKSGEYIHTCCT